MVRRGNNKEKKENEDEKNGGKNENYGEDERRKDYDKRIFVKKGKKKKGEKKLTSLRKRWVLSFACSSLRLVCSSSLLEIYSLRSFENSMACVSAVCKFATRPTISSLRRSPSLESKLIAASLVRLLPEEEPEPE